jgi:hypothetical protein
MRLTSELTLTTDFECDARYLSRERAQSYDHAIYRVLEVEDLAARVDLDLLGEVAEGDGFCDERDGAHLRCQVGGELVHDTGELAPGAFDIEHERLATEFTV